MLVIIVSSLVASLIEKKNVLNTELLPLKHVFQASGIQYKAFYAISLYEY